jgi:hypothetical protein
VRDRWRSTPSGWRDPHALSRRQVALTSAIFDNWLPPYLKRGSARVTSLCKGAVPPSLATNDDDRSKFFAGYMGLDLTSFALQIQQQN